MTATLNWRLYYPVFFITEPPPLLVKSRKSEILLQIFKSPCWTYFFWPVRNNATCIFQISLRPSYSNGLLPFTFSL